MLHGWRFYPDWHRDLDHAPLEEFQRQTRDLYIPVGDVGFWQGAFRDTELAGYEEDPDGQPRWLASSSRHWNIDRPDPR